MAQSSIARRFISLKWKILALNGLVVLFLAASFTAFTYIEMRRQFADRRENLQHQYALQAQGLLDLSARRLKQLGTMVAALPVVQARIRERDLSTVPSETLEALISILQLNMGVELVSLVDASGGSLVGPAVTDAGRGGKLAQTIRSVMQTERPSVVIDCLATCLQYAVTPVLDMGGGTSAALVLGISLADVILDFQRVSGTDLGLVIERPSKPDLAVDEGRRLESWQAEVVALTNSTRNLAILRKLTKSVGHLDQLEVPVPVRFESKDLEVRLFPLTGFGNETGHLLVIADVSEAMDKIRIATERSLMLVGGGLGASLLLLLIMLRKPMSRIRQATAFLPRLADGQFRAVRSGVLKSLSRHRYADEVDVLNETTIELSHQLQRLNSEVAERMREVTTERNFVTHVLDSAQVIILTQDSQHRILRINRYGQKLLGIEPGITSFLDMLDPSSGREVVARWLGELVTGDREHFEAEFDVRCGDGKSIDVVWQHSRLQNGDGHRAVILSVGMDITARKIAEVRLAWLADHDPLTGLFNRRRFEEELERSIRLACRYGQTGALIFFDLDQFKFVNDTSGHRAGDDLLKAVSDTVPELLRGEDVIGRLGGDEFGIILGQIDREGAVDVAKKILGHIAKLELKVGERKHKVSASLGIALFPEHGREVQELLARADLAMYRVKDSGRGGWYLISSDDQSQHLMNERVLWKQRVENAMTEDRFVLYLQPIVAISDLTVSHFEVLLRMREDDGSIVAPTYFISVAERSGLIHRLDRMVLTKAIAYLVSARNRGLRLTLTVNLSAHAFNDPNLVDYLEQQLAEQNLDPHCLVLEMTETAALADHSAARLLMERINSIGCRFALDDFGTGFSSFYYLKHLPFEFIKIDGSFIRNLADRPDDLVLVKAMAEIATAYRKKSVAEQVEDQATLDLLKELHIDFAQGYHTGHPRPIEDVLTELESVHQQTPEASASV